MLLYPELNLSLAEQLRKEIDRLRLNRKRCAAGSEHNYPFLSKTNRILSYSTKSCTLVELTTI